jgi:hypothetical protein
MRGNLANIKIAAALAALLSAGNAGADRYGGEFLNIPVGARAQALGGAYGSVADDPSAVYWNPGALSRQAGYELMAGHSSLLDGLADHDFLAASGPVSSKMWLGLGWVRLGVDGIPRFSHTVGTPPQGDFSDNENALLASAAFKHRIRPTGRTICLNSGVSLKLIYNRLDNHQATGLGMDAGLVAVVRLADVFYPANDSKAFGEMIVDPRRRFLGTLSLSLAITDIGGTAISWDTPRQHQDVRPAAARIGVSYLQPLAFLRSSALACWETSTEPLQKSRAGAELELYRRLFLRGGWDRGQAVWGGGAAVWRLRLDYAWNGHDLGNTHRVSIAIKL